MKEETDFSNLMQTIRARRETLGITDHDDEACRNIGTHRTLEKRALLARIAARCAKAGVAPLEANY